MTYWSNFAKHG